MCRGPCSKWPACGEQRTTCESRVSPSPKWNLKSNPSHCARWWVPLSNNPPHWLLSLIILKKKSIFQVCQKIFVILTKVYLYASLWVYSKWLKVPKRVGRRWQILLQLELPIVIYDWAEFCELKSYAQERQKVILTSGLSLQSTKYCTYFASFVNIGIHYSWLFFWNCLLYHDSVRMGVLFFFPQK